MLSCQRSPPLSTKRRRKPSPRRQLRHVRQGILRHLPLRSRCRWLLRTRASIAGLVARKAKRGEYRSYVIDEATLSFLTISYQRELLALGITFEGLNFVNPARPESDSAAYIRKIFPKMSIADARRGAEVYRNVGDATERAVAIMGECEHDALSPAQSTLRVMRVV